MQSAAGIADRSPASAEVADLFVYGTLTNPATLRRVLGRTRPALPAILKDYRRRDGKYPYLVSASGQRVKGWVLRKIRSDEFKILDTYEATEPQRHHGAMRRLYSREKAKVVTTGGVSICCWVYIPNLADWPESWR